MLRAIKNLIYPLALFLMAVVGTMIAWPKPLDVDAYPPRFPIVLPEAEIYVRQFISPDIFFEGQKPQGGTSVDITTWRSDSVPELGSGIGYASYWKELPRLDPGSYEITFDFATSAYEAFLMPKGFPERAIRVAAGKPGRNSNDEIPFLKRNTLSFQVQDGDNWQLMVHLSNFHRTYGGFWTAPRIAPSSKLSTEANLKTALNFAIAGSMIIIMFYTYMLFNRRPSDLPALFLSLTCLAVLLRLIGIENLFSYFRDEVESRWVFEISARMEYGSMALVTMVFLEFLRRTFTTAILPTYVYIACHVANTILLTTAILTPVSFFTQWVGLYQANVIAHVLCMIVITTLALRNKEDGAGYMLASAIIPLLTAAVDVFQSRQGGTSYVSHFGGAFFIFLQSQILAKRFAKAYEQVAHLSQNLQAEVKRQTLQIRNIMDNVPEGLFTVGKDLKIKGQTSQYVEVLFPEARLNNFPDLLAYNTRIDRSNLDMTVSVLLSIIGEDSIAWEINHEHLFDELETHDQRLLTFQWHPIMHGDLVDEMLVIVRDTTELRNLRQRTLHHEQEMILISALAKARNYYQFREQARTQLVSMHSVWASHRLASDKSYIRVILAMLHTLKGNSRQIGFTKLARDLHDFEQMLLDLRETHGEDAADFGPALEAGFRIIEGELKFIDGLHRRYWGEAELPRERHITSYSERFLDRWQDLKADIKAIAETLGKKPPEFRLSIGEEIRMPVSFQNGLFNAMGHILRNAIDHGIESRAERRLSGKPEQGLIRLNFKSHGKGIILTIEDDGRGLDVDKILQKAGLSRDKDLGVKKVFELIVASGFSTASDINQISGRGVGMEAVRLEVERLGGKMEFVATESILGGSLPAFVPFKIVLTFSEIS